MIYIAFYAIVIGCITTVAGVVMGTFDLFIATAILISFGLSLFMLESDK